MLSKYINANQTDWDSYIDGIVLAYNTTSHETTGITPYWMMFGKEVRLPIDTVTKNKDQHQEIKQYESAYVRYLENNYMRFTNSLEIFQRNPPRDRNIISIELIKI